MTTKTVFYKKVQVGKSHRYEPVSEYDPDLIDSLPYGAHVQVCKEHGMSRRYAIDPALAPMVAASMILEDKLADIISKASNYNIDKQQDVKQPLTQEQADAWEKLNQSFGGYMTTLYGPSMRDVAESILKEISAEAEKLLTNDALREQYEHFLLLAKMSKNGQENNIR